LPQSISGIGVVVANADGDRTGELVKLGLELSDGLLEVRAETLIDCVVASEMFGVILAVPVPVGVRVPEGVSVPVLESLGGGGSGCDCSPPILFYSEL
jgi:hypothetical protein